MTESVEDGGTKWLWWWHTRLSSRSPVSWPLGYHCCRVGNVSCCGGKRHFDDNLDKAVEVCSIINMTTEHDLSKNTSFGDWSGLRWLWQKRFRVAPGSIAFRERQTSRKSAVSSVWYMELSKDEINKSNKASNQVEFFAKVVNTF